MEDAAVVTVAPAGRHRWKVLAAGVAANASFSAIFSGIPVTSVLLRAQYQLSNAQLGLALGRLSLGVALGELPWGVLTDRLGERKVLLTGLTGTVLALWLLIVMARPGNEHAPDRATDGGCYRRVAVALAGGSCRFWRRVWRTDGRVRGQHRIDLAMAA